MEVRAHDVPFTLQDGQRAAKLVFEELTEVPSILYGQEIGSAYHRQERMLIKTSERNTRPTRDNEVATECGIWPNEPPASNPRPIEMLL